MTVPTGPGADFTADQVVAELADRDRDRAMTAHYFGGPYRYVKTLPFIPRHFEREHLDNAAAADLLSIARNAYFGEAICWPGIGVDAVWTAARRVTIEYESEAFADELLLAGVRAVGRTNRTLSLHQAVWTATGREVLRCEAVIVTFDARLRSAIPVPDEFWALIDTFDGPMRPPPANT
jgi:acyl-CoA thioesterase FadM